MRDRPKRIVGELEGQNRALDKELRKAKREIARLQKQLLKMNITAKEFVEEEPKEIKEKGHKVSNPISRDSKTGLLFCDKCFELSAKEVLLGEVRGVARNYLICTNKKCRHSKKI